MLLIHNHAAQYTFRSIQLQNKMNDIVPPMGSSYCQMAEDDPIFKNHHDHEHGRFPDNDAGLLERLCLEIMQAGLSWKTIMIKQQDLKEIWNHYDPRIIAQYDEHDIARIMSDRRGIRHFGKIKAIIANAQFIISLDKNDGGKGFAEWLYAHQNLTFAEWQKLFKEHFRFTGPTIIHEFLMGIGFIDEAHHPNCPLFKKRNE